MGLAWLVVHSSAVAMATAHPPCVSPGARTVRGPGVGAKGGGSVGPQVERGSHFAAVRRRRAWAGGVGDISDSRSFRCVPTSPAGRVTVWSAAAAEALGPPGGPWPRAWHLYPYGCTCLGTGEPSSSGPFVTPRGTS